MSIPITFPEPRCIDQLFSDESVARYTFADLAFGGRVAYLGADDDLILQFPFDEQVNADLRRLRRCYFTETRGSRGSFGWIPARSSEHDPSPARSGRPAWIWRTPRACWIRPTMRTESSATRSSGQLELGVG